MANTKNSSAREIILDRLLKHRCGYSVYELCDMVNRSLQLEGFSPVTPNTIRNDLTTIHEQYKRVLHVEKRGYAKYYRYKDTNSTIFTNVLTHGEIQHLRSALLCIRACDQIRGSLMYQDLTNRLSTILNIDSASDPIVIYEKIPPMNEIKRFKILYEHIQSKTPATITVCSKEEDHEKVITIHPYYLYQKENEWSLLCHDSTNDNPAEIPLKCIQRLVSAEEIEFIPNHDFPLKDFYAKHFSRG